MSSSGRLAEMHVPTSSLPTGMVTSPPPSAVPQVPELVVGENGGSPFWVNVWTGDTVCGTDTEEVRLSTSVRVFVQVDRMCVADLVRLVVEAAGFPREALRTHGLCVPVLDEAEESWLFFDRALPVSVLVEAGYGQRIASLDLDTMTHRELLDTAPWLERPGSHPMSTPSTGIPGPPAQNIPSGVVPPSVVQPSGPALFIQLPTRVESMFQARGANVQLLLHQLLGYAPDSDEAAALDMWIDRVDVSLRNVLRAINQTGHMPETQLVSALSAALVHQLLPPRERRRYTQCILLFDGGVLARYAGENASCLCCAEGCTDLGPHPARGGGRTIQRHAWAHYRTSLVRVHRDRNLGPIETSSYKVGRALLKERMPDLEKNIHTRLRLEYGTPVQEKVRKRALWLLLSELDGLAPHDVAEWITKALGLRHSDAEFRWLCTLVEDIRVRMGQTRVRADLREAPIKKRQDFAPTLLAVTARHCVAIARAFVTKYSDVAHSGEPSDDDDNDYDSDDDDDDDGGDDGDDETDNDGDDDDDDEEEEGRPRRSGRKRGRGADRRGPSRKRSRGL